MKTILVSMIMSMSFNSFGYYYYNSVESKPSTVSEMRMACGNCETASKKETFYGQSMGPTGFSMSIPESYVHVMKYCFGLSTDANKMMERALTIEDSKTIKRLECYTAGLNKDISTFEMDGESALSIAETAQNETAINFLKK